MAMNGKHSLIRQFAVSSLVSILLIVLLFGYSSSRFLTDKLLTREATLTAEFITSVVNTDELWRIFEHRGHGDTTLQVDYFYRHLLHVPGVVHANIYDVDQRILWTADQKMIGKKFGPNEELSEALKGRFVYETGIVGAARDKEEHQQLLRDKMGMHFVEIYTPVWNESHDRVVGVVELYKAPRVLSQSIQEAHRLVWTVALISAVLLYLALFWIVRRASHTIEEQHRRLVESESLSMIGETASAVAHAMRNPLASIRASAELTLNDDLAGARESAQDIITEADRLDRWARNLLEFSRVGTDPVSSVDAVEVLEKVLEEHRPMIDAHAIELHNNIPDGPLRVVADATPLAQIFGNLLVNSIEAMANGGRLDVVADASTDGRNPVLKVVIRDTGGGLPSSIRGRLFKPFTTTKPQGTGLGLALSQRLLRHYGGDLTIDDQPGIGVTATVRLRMRMGE